VRGIIRCSYVNGAREGVARLRAARCFTLENDLKHAMHSAEPPPPAQRPKKLMLKDVPPGFFFLWIIKRMFGWIVCSK